MSRGAQTLKKGHVIKAIKGAMEAGLNVQDLLRRLYLRHAGLGAWNSHLLVAVDVDYVERGHVLKDGDVISVMPPVQGG